MSSNTIRFEYGRVRLSSNKITMNETFLKMIDKLIKLNKKYSKNINEVIRNNSEDLDYDNGIDNNTIFYNGFPFNVVSLLPNIDKSDMYLYNLYQKLGGKEKTNANVLQSTRLNELEDNIVYIKLNEVITTVSNTIPINIKTEGIDLNMTLEIKNLDNLYNTKVIIPRYLRAVKEGNDYDLILFYKVISNVKYNLEDDDNYIFIDNNKLQGVDVNNKKLVVMSNYTIIENEINNLLWQDISINHNKTRLVILLENLNEIVLQNKLIDGESDAIHSHEDIIDRINFLKNKLNETFPISYSYGEYENIYKNLKAFFKYYREEYFREVIIEMLNTSNQFIIENITADFSRKLYAADTSKKITDRITKGVQDEMINLRQFKDECYKVSLWLSKESFYYETVSPNGTSCVCSVCNTKIDKWRDYSGDTTCPICGSTLDRDVNAAINIKYKALGVRPNIVNPTKRIKRLVKNKTEEAYYASVKYIHRKKQNTL